MNEHVETVENAPVMGTQQSNDLVSNWEGLWASWFDPALGVVGPDNRSANLFVSLAQGNSYCGNGQ